MTSSSKASEIEGFENGISQRMVEIRSANVRELKVFVFRFAIALSERAVLADEDRNLHSHLAAGELSRVLLPSSCAYCPLALFSTKTSFVSLVASWPPKTIILFVEELYTAV